MSQLKKFQKHFLVRQGAVHSTLNNLAKMYRQGRINILRVQLVEAVDLSTFEGVIIYRETSIRKVD